MSVYGMERERLLPWIFPPYRPSVVYLEWERGWSSHTSSTCTTGVVTSDWMRTSLLHHHLSLIYCSVIVGKGEWECRVPLFDMCLIQPYLGDDSTVCPGSKTTPERETSSKNVWCITSNVCSLFSQLLCVWVCMYVCRQWSFCWRSTLSIDKTRSATSQQYGTVCVGVDCMVDRFTQEGVEHWYPELYYTVREL